MIRLVRLLHLRSLRVRWLRSALAALAVGAGVAIAVVLLIVQTSVARSVESFSSQVAGPATLKVTGPVSSGGISKDAVHVIRSVDGVSAALPTVWEVGAYTDADDVEHRVLVLGLPCEAQMLVLGSCPAGGAVSGSIGSSARTLLTPRSSTPLVDAVPVPALDGFNDGDVVVLPLELALEQYRRGGRFDTVFVVTSEAEVVEGRLRAALGPRFVVEEASAPPLGVMAAVGSFLQLLGLIAVFAVGVGGVLAYNSLALTLEERRRELAIVSALGGSARTLTCGLLSEAAFLGAVGGVVGFGLAAVLSTPIMGAISDASGATTGMVVSTQITLGSLLLAGALGTIVALAASAVPLRRALRLDVAGELSHRDLRMEFQPRRRVVLTGLIALFAALSLVPLTALADDGFLESWQAVVGYLSFGASVLALAMLGGLIAPPAIDLLSGSVARRSPRLRLTLDHLARTPMRTTVMAGAVAGSVALAVVISTTMDSARSGGTRNLVTELDGRLEVLRSSDAAEDLPLPPETQFALGGVPGVARIDAFRTVLVAAADPPISVTAWDDDALDMQFFRGTGDRARFESGQALVSLSYARRYGIEPGDVIPLPGLHETRHVEVLGVIEAGFFGGDAIRIPMTLFEALWGDDRPELAYVTPQDGVSADQVASKISAAQLDPRIDVRTGAEVADIAADEFAGIVQPFWVAQRALLIVSGIAVVATLLLTNLQRRRELGIIAAIGTTPPELRTTVGLEAVVVGAAGALTGIGTGLGLAYALNRSAVLMLGFDNDFHVDVSAAMTWPVLAIGFVAMSAIWPAARAARIDVPAALRYE